MMTFFHWFVAIYLVLSDVHTFYSLPAIDDNAIDFLRNFGYLPQKKASTDGIIVHDIHHGDTLINAIKLLQQYGAIEQTGELDEATKELLKKPRCGRPDVETPETMRVDENEERRRHKRFALMNTKWEFRDKDYLTWAYMNVRHPRNEREKAQIRRLTAEAISVWQHNSVLKFQETHPNDANDADIKIDFARLDHGDGYNFTGPSGTLAHAFPPSSGIGGDVHMDDDESWDIEDGNGGDVSYFYTLLHELGHSLGLSHSNTTDSIMYAWYVSTREWDRKCGALYEDDIHGIAQHYGSKREFKWGPRCMDNSYPKTPTKVPTRHTTQRTPQVDVRTYRPDNRPVNPPRTTPRTPNYPDRDRPYDPNEDPRRRPSYPDRDRDREPHREPSIPRDDEIPDRCKTNFDAIITLRGELLIFKGRWFWRLVKDQSGKYKPMSNEPYSIGAMWSSLKDFDHIDAVYEMKDGNLAFFVDRKIYIMDLRQGHKIIGVSDLRHFGFDHRLKKVDAIFKWNYNNSTYVMSGDFYWKVDENLRVDRSQDADRYPRRIGHPFWKGVTEIDVDTAITFNSITYFLSGLVTYKFDNGYSKLELDNPIVSSEFWMDCKHSDGELEVIKTSARMETSSAPTIATTISVFMIFLLSFSHVML